MDVCFATEGHSGVRLMHIKRGILILGGDFFLLFRENNLAIIKTFANIQYIYTVYICDYSGHTAHYTKPMYSQSLFMELWKKGIVGSPFNLKENVIMIQSSFFTNGC